ncbi:MAG: amino acid permease, partial [Planctomycetaceae bacterium]
MASKGQQKSHRKLGELSATAICGNDITSSCLYVSALATMAAAHLSPISLLIVAAVLFLFRKIYAEVVGALPLNGGAYNALLNTTSKSRASMAACLTLLSYMATAVISAIEAMHYVHSLWHGLNVMIATVVLLAVFAGLTIVGITESAKVAIGIFLFHLATLGLLIIVGLVWILGSGDSHLAENFKADEPIRRQMVVNDSMLENQDSGPAAVSPETEPDAADRVGEGGGVQDAVDQLQDGHLPGSLKSYLGDKGIEINGETVRPVDDGEGRRWAVGDEGMEILADKENSMLVVLTRTSLWTALFFGFCAAMLGISGFESSANFVEEQEPGVFPKTLRNMWWAVSILNPTMALLTLAVLPVAEV